MPDVTEELSVPDSGIARDATRTSTSTPRHLRQTSCPSIVGTALLGVARARVKMWDRALAKVEEAQHRVLLDIVRHARHTEFGVKHDFGRIRRYEDFARRIPVGNYDSFSPYLERMRKGERNLLVPEFVRHFGNSSGTSTQGKQKFLPIAERQVADQRAAGADMLMRYLASTADSEFVRGFTLGLFPPITMREEGPVLITSNPALMVTRMPWVSRSLYLPSDDIKRIADYERRSEAIAERYLDWDVRALAGTTCWFAVLFDKVLEVARRRKRHASRVCDVWPNLRVLFGGGVSAEPYLPVLRRQIGRDDVKLVDSYNATEGGVYGATDFTGAAGMAMLPHRGTFFEFVPLASRETHAPRVPLWGVQRDELYSIVVTTRSGLYSYELGDIVRFPSVAPHRIEFAGRLSGCLSVSQELTNHIEIERALRYAAEKCACRTVDFGAAADIGVGGSGKSRYVLFAEFDEGAEPTDLPAFAAAFDEGLKAENRVYREHRAGDALIVAPRVVPLRAGATHRFLELTTAGNVQGKFPRILDEAGKVKLLSFARSSSDPS